MYKLETQDKREFYQVHKPRVLCKQQRQTLWVFLPFFDGNSLFVYGTGILKIPLQKDQENNTSDKLTKIKADPAAVEGDQTILQVDAPCLHAWLLLLQAQVIFQHAQVDMQLEHQEYHHVAPAIEQQKGGSLVASVKDGQMSW